MKWLYNLNYFGPDRRGKRGFNVRFFERRHGSESGDRAALREALRAQGEERNLRWVDHPNYFGPDRRTGAFSHYILERREHNGAGAPPRLELALRALSIRFLEAADPKTRALFRDRLTATALLADAVNERAISDILHVLVDEFDRMGASDHLQSELLRAEAMLSDAARAFR
jgi:hypothetical protein